MDFTSDNSYGAMPEILDALAHVNAGPAVPYGEDEHTTRLQARMNAFFGREVAVFPVLTGTAANALALAALCPPHGAIFCHAESHIAVDECGAAEFFTHGARLVLLDGPCGKLAAQTIEAALPDFQRGVHGPKPSVVSITQASESGTVYRPDEIAALGALARRHGLKLHMDGARLFNALAHLGCAPADITWKAGVDALSFGATKNGALAAEAVVFFDPGAAGDFAYRRKKAGHLLSKMRFVSAQWEAMLEAGRWKTAAGHANAAAEKLAEGLRGLKNADIACPVEANAVFVRLPCETVERLRKAGARFYDWAAPREGRTLVRLVCSFATTDAEIARFLEIAAR